MRAVRSADTSLVVPNPPRRIRREARSEARKDAATSHLPLPSAYQQRLRSDCDHAIREDFRRRLPELARIRAAKSHNRERTSYTEKLVTAAKSLKKKLAARFETIAMPSWAGRLSGPQKWSIYAGLGMFEYLLIRVGINPLSVDDVIKNLIAVLLGIVPIVAIELNGSNLIRALTWHGERIERRTRWLFSLWMLVVLTGAIVGFLVVFGLVRAEGFDLVGGNGTFAISLAISLALLQGIATLAAAAVAKEQAEGDSWRETQRDLVQQTELIQDLEGDLTELSEEYAMLDELERIAPTLAKQRHQAIFDYFSDIEARYRAVLTRVRPDAGEEQATWEAWQEARLQALDPVYAELGPSRMHVALNPASEEEFTTAVLELLQREIEKRRDEQLELPGGNDDLGEADDA